MEPFEVLYRPEALADLETIYRYVLARSESATVASDFVTRIEARCTMIGIFPRSGRSRDDLVLGLRTIPFERRAVIAYVIRERTVLITNVFYGGRDYEALYCGSDDERFPLRGQR